jgi:hypothetical protein
MELLLKDIKNIFCRIHFFIGKIFLYKLRDLRRAEMKQRRE